MNKKSFSLWSGAGMAALALAAFGSAFLLKKGHHIDEFEPEQAPDTVIDGTYQVLDGEERAGSNALAERAAAAAMLTGITASVVGIFGVNRFLNMLLAFGRWVAGAAKKGAEQAAGATVKAAKATAGAAAKVARKPGKWILIFGGLTLFVFTGISVLDIQWQAGLVTGAAGAIAGIYGVDRAGKAVGKMKDSVAAGFKSQWGKMRTGFGGDKASPSAV